MRAGGWRRWLVAAHRWGGLILGPLVVLWCLSGAVMLYVGYPELTGAERSALLPELGQRAQPPRAWPAELDAATDARLERIDWRRASRLVVRAPALPPHLFDAITGEPLSERDEATLTSIAGSVRIDGTRHDVVRSSRIDRDQWTVAGRFDRHRPLQRVLLADAAATELYISTLDASIVQQTTRRERFWNWPGAVSHWLYLTVLRERATLWAQVVIVTSFATLLLLVAGVLLSWRPLLVARAKRRLTVFRGALRWHHLSTLAVGGVAITWTLSGLLSMNPLGLLVSGSAEAERERVRWLNPAGPHAQSLSRTLHATLDNAPDDAVTIQVAPFAGRLQAITSTNDEVRQRFDANGQPAPLSPRRLEEVAQSIRSDARAVLFDWLTHGDAYYYSHHQTRSFPVLRVTVDDEQHTRYYLDGVSGELIRKVDRSGRWYRWLHLGLHRLDFPMLRVRPWWDVLVLTLLGGVTFAACSGLWAGLSHLRRSSRS